jgi:hypothetical protein
MGPFAPLFIGITCLYLANESDGLQIWLIAADILNKLLQTTRTVWSLSLGVQGPVNIEVPVLSWRRNVK